MISASIRITARGTSDDGTYWYTDKDGYYFAYNVARLAFFWGTTTDTSSRPGCSGTSVSRPERPGLDLVFGLRPGLIDRVDLAERPGLSGWVFTVKELAHTGDIQVLRPTRKQVQYCVTRPDLCESAAASFMSDTRAYMSDTRAY
jgi:hypothetical protein